MLYRVLPSVVVALIVGLIIGMPVSAGEKAKTHEGIIVKAGDNKLIMTDKDGKNEHTMKVADSTKILCDGKACELSDLRKGFEVTVTMDADSKVVTRIEAKKKSE